MTNKNGCMEQCIVINISYSCIHVAMHIADGTYMLRHVAHHISMCYTLHFTVTTGIDQSIYT